MHTDAAAVPSTPAAAPADRYAGPVEEARRLARALVVASNVPGLSVAVLVDGEIVWAEGFGWTDADSCDSTSTVSLSPAEAVAAAHHRAHPSVPVRAETAVEAAVWADAVTRRHPPAVTAVEAAAWVGPAPAKKSSAPVAGAGAAARHPANPCALARAAEEESAVARA